LIYRCLEGNIYLTNKTNTLLESTFRTNEHIKDYFKNYEPQTTISGKLKQIIFTGVDNIHGFLSLIANKPLHWVRIEPTYSYSKMLAIKSIQESVNKTLGLVRDPFLGVMKSPELCNVVAQAVLEPVQNLRSDDLCAKIRDKAAKIFRNIV
jgi:hypothetical protein